MVLPAAVPVGLLDQLWHGLPDPSARRGRSGGGRQEVDQLLQVVPDRDVLPAKLLHVGGEQGAPLQDVGEQAGLGFGQLYVPLQCGNERTEGLEGGAQQVRWSSPGGAERP